MIYKKASTDQLVAGWITLNKDRYKYINTKTTAVPFWGTKLCKIRVIQVRGKVYLWFLEPFGCFNPIKIKIYHVNIKFQKVVALF